MKKNKDIDKIFESFDKGEQETIGDILHAASLSPDKTVVSQDETEIALMNVRKTLGLNENNANYGRGRKSPGFGQSPLWTIMFSVAAAVITFFLYSSFFQLPRYSLPTESS